MLDSSKILGWNREEMAAKVALDIVLPPRAKIKPFKLFV